MTYLHEYIETVKASLHPLIKVELDHFELSLERLIKSSKPDPCEARTFSNLGWKFGYGSKINGLIFEVWLPTYALAVRSITRASYGNTEEPSWAFCSGDEFFETFSELFDLSHLPVCRVGCADRAISGYLTGIRDVVKTTVSAQGAKGLGLIAEQFATILRHVVRYLPETASFLEEKRKLMVSPYIGVHIRRGDKFIEAPPIESYKYAEEVKSHASWPGKASMLGVDVNMGLTSNAKYVEYMVKKVAKGKNITDVFLASDDPHALKEMKVLLQGQLTVTAFDHSFDRNSRDYRKVEFVKDLLADLHLLESSTIFIGTGTSNIGRLVFLSRGADYLNSVSVDEPFDSFFF